MPSYTIADAFKVHLKGYYRAINLKKPVKAFRALKKGGVFVDVECATKNSLRHYATFIGIAIGGVG